MKKGALFSLLIVILVLIFIVAAFLLLFRISNVQLESTNTYLKETDNELTTYVNSYKDKNIFAFSKKTFTEDLENKFPYIEVENIEMVFPSTVKVTVKERVSLFAINKDSKFYIFDKEGLLIKIQDSNVGGDGNYACVEIDGIDSEDLDLIKGDELGIKSSIIDTDYMKNVMKLFDVMYRLEYEYTDTQIKAFFSSIELNVEKDMTIYTRYGNRIVIYDFDENTEQKIQLVIGAISTGKVTNPDQKIVIGNDLVPVLTNN